MRTESEGIKVCPSHSALEASQSDPVAGGGGSEQGQEWWEMRQWGAGPISRACIQ